MSDVLRDPGAPLDQAARAFFEPRFGHDFSQVRVHTDTRAAESAQAVNAQAYTVGGDIVFGAGQYSPRSESGRHLLGHELTHVVQQAGASGLDATASEASERAAEVEAESNAHALGAGEGMALQAGPMPRLLQRQAQPAAPAAAPAAAAAQAPAAREIPRQIRSIDNVPRRGFGQFDASLESGRGGGNPPCQLTVTTKVKFNFPNTSGVWPQGLPARWTTQFVEQVQQKWSYRYLLLRAGSCSPDEVCERVAVRVRVLPVETGQHHTVNVLYSNPSGDRSFVAGSQARTGTFHGSDINTNTAFHETGHFFGLEHIACDDNGFTCYGMTAGTADDVMGRGAFVSARDYEPFIDVMRTLTHCEWRTHSTHTREVPSWMIGAGVLGLMLGVGLTGALGMGLGWMIGTGLALGAIGAFVGWAIDMT